VQGGTDDDAVVRGRWVRGKRIGVGSSGEVYLVRDETHRLDFAAKLVVPRDAEAAARLEDEIALMSHMRHAHLLEYLGAAKCGTDRYMLLELCQGGSVRDLIDAHYPSGLPAALLLDYSRQLLSGLHYLHEAMIIHRDLKGDNLLLDAAHTTLKLADFGSYHELEADATLSHDVSTIRGSPYWMSPEHVQGARCGRKADVWSFGCVLLEMQTGSPPWQPAAGQPTPAGHFAVFQLLSRIVESTGPPPMPPAETMPHGLHEVLLACFERDLERRPTTDALYSFPWFEGGRPQARAVWDRGDSSS